VSERTSSATYHYLFDGLGSVVGLMDFQENLVDSYVYDPYGVTEHQTGTRYNPWQFAGGYFDSYTLYYKYGTRYYDRFGRWTQKDPVPSANPYVYASDDPVNEVDPSGRIAVVLVLGLVACIGGAIGNEASLVYSNGPGNSPSLNSTIKTLIAGCITGVVVGLIGVYGFTEGVVALTLGNVINAGLLSVISGALFGILYKTLNTIFPG